jgi:hypothetical protein
MGMGTLTGRDLKPYVESSYVQCRVRGSQNRSHMSDTEGPVPLWHL